MIHPAILIALGIVFPPFGIFLLCLFGLGLLVNLCSIILDFKYEIIAAIPKVLIYTSPLIILSFKGQINETIVSIGFIVSSIIFIGYAIYTCPPSQSVAVLPKQSEKEKLINSLHWKRKSNKPHYKLKLKS